MMLLALLAVQGLVPDMDSKKAEKLLSKAHPVASCAVGPDCDMKWSRAREWVAANSRFTLVIDTDQAILTHRAIYANTDASYAVALDAPANGVRTIRFRAWCGNFIGCLPKTNTLETMFKQALDAKLNM